MNVENNQICWNYFMKIEADKWRHFYAGVAMAIILCSAGALMNIELKLVFIFSFIIVVSISFGFEIFSLISGLGRYDIWDAVATIIGAIFGMGICVSLF